MRMPMNRIEFIDSSAFTSMRMGTAIESVLSFGLRDLSVMTELSYAVHCAKSSVILCGASIGGVDDGKGRVARTRIPKIRRF